MENGQKKMSETASKISRITQRLTYFVLSPVEFQTCIDTLRTLTDQFIQEAKDEYEDITDAGEEKAE